jgi:predicted DCC family thiol-disulfide oxidoreductase YuxK
MTTPILLYDGTCGFCDATVKFVLRHDPAGPLRFAALESARGRAVCARHPDLAGVDSMVWVENAAGQERVWTRSDAVLRLLNYLGGVWHLARAFRILPRALRDRMYDAIARRRYRWFGRVDVCPVPVPAQRVRFITD